MQYHKELGPAPTFGVELEVADYAEGSIYTAAKKMEDHGYMPESTFSRNRHDYHCRCNVCEVIGSQVVYPGQWKLQRDGSLPDDGGEFISSPFIATESFFDHMREGLTIISDGAIGENDYDEEEIVCGLHVHVHSQGPWLKGMYDDSVLYDGAVKDLPVYGQKLLYSFAPELFTLASSAGIERGLSYRTPSKSGDSHHSFVSPSATGNKRRLEWRLWEAAYHDVDYMMGAIVFSIAATQLLHRENVATKMGAIAALIPWNDQNKRMENILSEFSQERLDLLGDALLNGTSVKGNEYTTSILTSFLERVNA